MRDSFAGMAGTAEGLPLTFEIRLVDIANGCAPLVGHALYLWHCDADGRYSLYELPEVNYLRALGVSDAEGVVRFTTIFPGCYGGRWPHLHFEVFASAEQAVTGRQAVLTSQFVLPGDVSAQVYDLPRYATSADNLTRLSLARDNVFRDNSAEQIAVMTPEVSGDMTSGLTARVTIGLQV
jgi:protocatechuate 3,4-dioxygenase beta subunit